MVFEGFAGPAPPRCRGATYQTSDAPVCAPLVSPGEMTTILHPWRVAAAGLRISIEMKASAKIRGLGCSRACEVHGSPRWSIPIDLKFHPKGGLQSAAQSSFKFRLSKDDGTARDHLLNPRSAICQVPNMTDQRYDTFVDGLCRGCGIGFQCCEDCGRPSCPGVCRLTLQDFDQLTQVGGSGHVQERGEQRVVEFITGMIS